MDMASDNLYAILTYINVSPSAICYTQNWKTASEYGLKEVFIAPTQIVFKDLLIRY